MARFQLPDDGVAFTVRPGELVTAAARRAKVFLDARCGGHGVCKGCTVEVLAGRVELERTVTEVESARLVQGCRCRLLDDRAEIRVPRSSLISLSPIGDAAGLPHLRRGNATVRRRRVPPAAPLAEATLAAAVGADRVAMAAGERVAVRRSEGPRPIDAVVAARWGAAGTLWEVVDLLPADAPALLGLAADIGTTTVAMALVDLESGEPLGYSSAYNRQLQCCDDVAARIVWAGNERGRQELRDLLVRETLEPLAHVLCAAQGRSAAEVRRLSVAGNPTMIHLLLDLDPTAMGAFPFRAAELAPDDLPANRVGLELGHGALLSCLPAAAPYVGGDALAGVVVSGMLEDPRPCLLVDLGTNAEILLSVPQVAGSAGLLACAAPAGPAIEGMRLACGGRAGPGAVRRLRLSDQAWEPRLQVIGGSKPVVICGSGYLDFLAEGRRVGLLREGGRMALGRGHGFSRVRLGREGRRHRVEFVAADRSETADGDELLITEADVSQLLQAKAAIRAGIDVLLEQAGASPVALGCVYLCGGISAAMSVDSVLGCGLLPAVPADRVRALGNTALAGAVAGLVDLETGGALRALARRTEVVELNLHPSFEQRFAEALRGSP